MEFLPQPHGATCTERQSCATARGWGREIYLVGAPWHNARAKQALMRLLWTIHPMSADVPWGSLRFLHY